MKKFDYISKKLMQHWSLLWLGRVLIVLGEPVELGGRDGGVPVGEGQFHLARHLEDDFQPGVQWNGKLSPNAIQ